MQDSIPWYKSQVLIGLIVSLVLKVLVVTGLLGEVAPADAEALTNTIALVLSGLGDLWAMRARLTQKSAPSIQVRGTGTGTTLSAIGAMMVLPAAAVILAACTPLKVATNVLKTTPVEQANKTTLDEKFGLTVETVYKTWLSAVTTAINLKVLGPEQAAKLAALDNRVYDMVKLARRAYDAGNAQGYSEAMAELSQLIAEGAVLIKGGSV